MTTGKTAVVIGAAAIVIIRGIYQYGRPRPAVEERRAGALDTIALGAVATGFVIPIVWAVTGWLAFADTVHMPVSLVAGSAVMAGALWLFYRAHHDLGRNWSPTLQIVESQLLVTTGVYRLVRHPMYLALILYGLGQGLALSNWLAAPACLIGAATLFALRLRAEEHMMRDRFGAAYVRYASRTARLIPGLW